MGHGVGELGQAYPSFWGTTMQTISNEALLGAVSLIVAILTVVLPLFWRFLQSKRLKQEQSIHREYHNLKLFEALASGSHQLQLAAAAVLAERLVSKINNETRAEHRVIVRALLAVTKDLRTSNDDPGVSPELSKFVADQIGKNHKIALAEFDWQNSQVPGAWWPNIQAKGVDFWRANLKNVGMRGANLERAIFVEAALDGAVLAGANLKGARFERASLKGVDFSDAILTDANFMDATYDHTTNFPGGFDPNAAGLKLSEGQTLIGQLA